MTDDCPQTVDKERAEWGAEVSRGYFSITDKLQLFLHSDDGKSFLRVPPTLHLSL